MTCYETLRAPAPATDAPMAHHFVKWWRNKFRNGYKKFSIGTESERTDTEELVGRAVSQCSAPPDLLPSEARALLQPSTTPPPPKRTQRTAHHEPPYKPPPSPTPENNDDKQPRLRFEELTCDVELQHPEPSKQQPLQFSFTLYDLDGHGRMTKDDIAGIVSTIYESIGKSVTVPHYGSKTIQVRLTVVPEDGNTRSHRERREGRRRRRREGPPPPPPAAPPECADPSDEEQRERLSPDDDASSKSSCSGDRRQSHIPTVYVQSRPHRQPRREQRERRHTKKRSGSLQRRELLEIIQANMEKNHLSFQASRKPCESAVDDEIPNKYQKHRNRSYTISEKPTNAFQKTKSENCGNGYLDLAGGGESHLCRYDRYLHAVICSSARHAHTGFHHQHQLQHQHQHPPARSPRPRPRAARARAPRSRSHDLPTPTHAAQPTQKPAHPTPHQPRVLQIIFL